MLLDRIHTTARRVAREKGLLGLFTTPQEAVRLSDVPLAADRVRGLVEEGYLRRSGTNILPGFLLNLALAKSQQVDLCKLMPADAADLLQDRILHSCMILSPTRELALQHRNSRSTHYFEADRLLVANSRARIILTGVFSSLLTILPVGVLACTISPGHLIGSYPLCFHLALAANLDLFSIYTLRKEEITVVGGIHPNRGPALILNDVLTTGASTVRLVHELRKRGTRVLGALFVYDRLEGGREALLKERIDVVSLTSLRSLRAYCESTLHAHVIHATPRKKLRSFLQLTRRLQTTRCPFKMVLEPRPLIGVAAGMSLPLDRFAGFRFQKRDRRRILSQIASALDVGVKSRCQMIVFPELTVPIESWPLFSRATKKHPIVVVAGSEYDAANQNCAMIAVNGAILYQAKLIKSPYDAKTLVTGDIITVFEGTPVGNFAVMVCADLSNPQHFASIKRKVDLVVVVARNRAIRTFREMAVTESFRGCMYVLFANDENCGPTYLVSPEKGPRKVHDITRAPESELAFVRLEIGRLRRRSGEFLHPLKFNQNLREEESN